MPEIFKKNKKKIPHEDFLLSNVPLVLYNGSYVTLLCTGYYILKCYLCSYLKMRKFKPVLCSFNCQETQSSSYFLN